MEHARKMALVDPRLLDTLRSPPPPPATDTLGKKVQALDDEMKTILDRKDLDDGTKVTLYNQVLQRYNVLADKRIKEPLRVVTMNESEVTSESGSEGTARAPISGLEATVLATVPKTMQAKASRLMEHLKRDIAWTARGELIHEGVPVVGSNVVDLVNDLLRKRKTDPTGWQPFARQLRAINLRMALVGNVSRRAYIRPAPTVTPSRRSSPTPRAASGSARRALSWTPLARRSRRMEHTMPTPPPESRKALSSLAGWDDLEDGTMRVRSTVFVMSPDPQDLVYRSVVGAIFISGLYIIAHGLVLSFMPQTLFEPPLLDEWTIPCPPTHPPPASRKASSSLAGWNNV